MPRLTIGLIAVKRQKGLSTLMEAQVIRQWSDVPKELTALHAGKAVIDHNADDKARESRLPGGITKRLWRFSRVARDELPWR